MVQGRQWNKQVKLQHVWQVVPQWEARMPWDYGATQGRLVNCFLQEEQDGKGIPGQGSRVYLSLESSWIILASEEEEYENLTQDKTRKSWLWRTPNALMKSLNVVLYMVPFSGKKMYSDTHTHATIYILNSTLGRVVGLLEPIIYGLPVRSSRDQWRILSCSGMSPSNDWNGSTNDESEAVQPANKEDRTTVRSLS